MKKLTRKKSIQKAKTKKLIEETNEQNARDDRKNDELKEQKKD